MKFISKFPDDESFEPGDEWTPLKESSNIWVVQLQAVPFMVVNVALSILFLRLAGFTFRLDTMMMLLAFLVFAPIHELIHAVCFPESLRSENVFLGFTFNGFAPFAAYNGPMKRNRFILVLLAPLVAITFAGLAILLITGENNLIEHIVVFNALGASADCLGVYLILRQVPRNAIVRNKQIRTYWKNHHQQIETQS